MMDQLKNMIVFILIWPKRILKHVNSVQPCSYDHGVTYSPYKWQPRAGWPN